MPAREKHVPALDGLRGFAIILVLSGFLITGILYDAKGSSHYFRNFYMRRVLRIFPLYYGVLFLVFIVVPLFHPMTKNADQQFLHNQNWLWLYMANIPQAISNQWPLKTGWVNLNHFWSLAIEEHFYLLWPAMVFLLQRRTLMRICTTCIITALVLRCLTYFLWNDTAAYVLTPCRMDELAMGALAALEARAPGGIERMVRPAKWIAAILGLCLIVLWLQVMDDVNYTVALTTLSAFFAALLVTAVGGSATTHIFSSRILRFFGKYSYGIYVFHWMLTPALEKYCSHLKLAALLGSSFLGIISYMAIAAATATLAAFLSWHFYEKHFLKLKRFFEYSEKEEEVWPSARL